MDELNDNFSHSHCTSAKRQTLLTRLATLVPQDARQPVNNRLQQERLPPQNERLHALSTQLQYLSSQISDAGKYCRISPVAHMLNGVISTGFLGVVDQQTDTQAPNRRIARAPPSSASRPLPLNPDIPVLLKPVPFQSTTRGELNIAHNRSASSPPSSDLRRVDSSSSQSTSSMSRTSNLRRPFGFIVTPRSNIFNNIPTFCDQRTP